MPKKIQGAEFLRWAPAKIGQVLKTSRHETPLAHVWNAGGIWFGIWLAGGHQKTFDSQQEARLHFESMVKGGAK